MLGDTLRDANDQRNLSSNGFFNALGRYWRRHEDCGCGGSCLLYRLFHSRKDWPIQVLLAGLLRVGSTNDICAFRWLAYGRAVGRKTRTIVNCLLRVEAVTQLAEPGVVG